MINVPSLRPELLKTIETDFGSTIAVSIWKKTIDNHAWVEANLPIGFVLFFYGSTVDSYGNLIAQPNSNIWKLCNGQLISDVNSPLNGQYLPNFSSNFLKGFSTIGITGGQSTINLRHDHGDLVAHDDRADKVADDGNDRRTGSLHTHDMSDELSNTESVIPKYFSLQAYVRYK